MPEIPLIKQKLYSGCTDYVESKLTSIAGALDDLQQAANLETKSSMGDKYETGRASIQLEMEKYSNQLQEFTNLKKILFQINVNRIYESVQAGSLVYTTQGNYFIAINAGEFEIDGEKILSISLASPLGKELFRKMKGEKFTFRDKTFKIKNVL